MFLVSIRWTLFGYVPDPIRMWWKRERCCSKRNSNPGCPAKTTYYKFTLRYKPWEYRDTGRSFKRQLWSQSGFRI